MESDVPKAYLRRIGKVTDYKCIPLESNEVIVGRAKEVTYNIADLLISRKHAVFRPAKDHWTVESLGMNGIAVNHVNIPKQVPVALNHLDVIEFGFGSKYTYTFRLHSADCKEPQAKKLRTPFTNRNIPSIKDSPEAFRQWIVSKRSLEKTLVEEKEELDHRLEQQSSRQDQLFREQQLLTEQAESQSRQLELKFYEEKRLLEDKVARGEIEKTELQIEKDILEQRLTSCLEELKMEFERKTAELEQRIAQAETEKKIILDEKETVLQQLQREKETLEEQLEEERRSKEATILEVNQLTERREALERQLMEERQRFEEERQKLQQQGTEAEHRLNVLEQESIQRDQLLESTKAELTAKEKLVAEIQSRAAIGLELYDVIQGLHQNHEGVTDIVMMVNGNEVVSSGGVKSAEEELQRMREELRVTVAQKEEIEQQLKNASDKARSDVVGKLEDVVENELQCGICSELFVFATSLNCMHTFCQYCINLWKKNKRECPVCRTPIETEGRSFVIDSAIDGIVGTLSEELQKRRKALVEQRKQQAEQAAKELAAATAAAAARTSGRGGSRGRRNHPAPRQIQHHIPRPGVQIRPHLPPDYRVPYSGQNRFRGPVPGPMRNQILPRMVQENPTPIWIEQIPVRQNYLVIQPVPYPSSNIRPNFNQQ